MRNTSPSFNFAATGVGSVPFLDVRETCERIVKYLPRIPFWPQFVKRSYREDMSVQYTEGLPLLEISEEKRTLSVSTTSDPESELVTFYDHFFAHDLDYFSVTKNYAPGLHVLIELMEKTRPDPEGYIKGQTVGPVTFAAGLMDVNGKPVLYNAELLEAMSNGLSIKALWQVRELSKSGRKVIIFLDEPYLSGFGSAFSSIQRHEVIRILRTVIEYLRKHSDTFIGVHCCGNTDWSMIMEADPDIVNFDAFEYMEHFLLYADAIVRFIKKGGMIAWGIVPTVDAMGGQTVERLQKRLQEGLERVCDLGVDSTTLAKRSIITSACGMGVMDPVTAETGMELLAGLSSKLMTLQ